uniref:2'-5'-oligoadenylate synthetase 3 n=1 Tax=Homo sapiens TaxID=9606 RepID=A0A7P0TB72_HUMAN
MDLYSTPAAALDRFVARRLQPRKEFVEKARRALGALAAALRERGGRLGAAAPRVLKTVKAPRAGAQLSRVAVILNLSSSSTASRAMWTRGPAVQRSSVRCGHRWNPGGRTQSLV